MKAIFKGGRKRTVIDISGQYIPEYHILAYRKKTQKYDEVEEFEKEIFTIDRPASMVDITPLEREPTHKYREPLIYRYLRTEQ